MQHSHEWMGGNREGRGGETQGEWENGGDREGTGRGPGGDRG